MLVVAADTAFTREWVDRLRRHGRVTQVLPPRLALVVPGVGGLTDLAQLPGIALHADGPPDPEGLSEGERLFVDAWWLRRAGKSRRGDGLPWDSPGYLPPG